MGDSGHLTRRRVLALTGGAVGALGTTGVAAGEEGRGQERERVNVGYSRPSGRRAARREADRVYYEFAFDALTIEVSREGKRNLRQRDDIRYVERDGEMEALDHDQTLPWGVDRVDADVAHDNGETGGDDGNDVDVGGEDDPAGADIAIIDTGIDEDHPDLVENIGEGVAFLSGTKSDNWDDDNGHGTHCAGIADADDNHVGVVGVCTEATLHAVKVLNATGTGLTSDIAKGIEWTADQGYEVASLSLGGGDSETLREACEYAYGKGVFLSAAAGNDGCEDCVTYPAAYTECVAVSATTKDDDLADFSSYGDEIELAAPGEDIYSTYLGGTYDTLSGTSMACPHVSGGAGQLMDNGYSNEDARDQLKSTAEDIGLSKKKQGAGLLDVAAALNDSDDSTDDDSDGGGDPPEGTIDAVDEAQSRNPHAEFEVGWNADDPNGDLDSVRLTLYDQTDGETEESTTEDVSGGSASGTTTLTAKHDDGSGHDYEVTLTVTDEAGNTDSDSASVTES